MGMGHVPQEPIRAQGEGADVQGRQRRGASPDRSVTPSLAAVARGRWGEDLAARWYRRAGFTVVCRNWRGDAGEIDLVLRCGDLVVFSEVKARASERFGSAASAVGVHKQRRIRRLAAAWLASTDTHGVDVRFDVVTVTGTAVDVIEAAF